MRTRIINPTFTLILGVLGLLACGGGGSTDTHQPPPPPIVTVAVSPAAVSLSTGLIQKFTATVANAANTNVTWSVQEGAAGGSVDNLGTYIAPATVPGGTAVFHVVAFSAADPTKTGSATVTVTQPADGTVGLSPASVTLGAYGQAVITASVQGSSAGVDWSMQETAPGGYEPYHNHTLTQATFYWFETDGPQASDVWHLVATSKADPSKSAIATVTLNHPVRVLASPPNATLLPGGSQSFSATVQHSSNTAVTWSIQEGASGGVVSGSGQYTAPSTPGTYHVIATSAADPTKSGTAEVVVQTNTGGNWAHGGNLLMPRIAFKPILLPSGKILVAGGYDGISYVYQSSAEIYDPASGLSIPTGSMPEPRVRYGAALLPTGKVLITGGSNATTALSSALLFDPATGTFSPTSAMGSVRHLPLTIPLQDGTVLVAGGYSPSGQILASAEIYDPATGSFSPTGSLAKPRSYPSAVLLADGRVLVAGGWGGSGDLWDTAEIYVPSSRTFISASGNLIQKKYFFAGALLNNGRVLLAGGQNGGNLSDPASYFSSADLFDPLANALSPGFPMATSRESLFLFGLKDGRALAIGGQVATGFTATCELFNSTSGTWSQAAPLGLARDSGGGAVLLQDGRVVVLGGWAMPGATSSIEIYTP